jgi:two-component system KDP operon response regulator KdpE
MTHTKVALVADASAEIRRSLKEGLSSLGFLTIESGDGFHLLDRLRKMRPSLVVIDLGLPGLDGTEVLHFIRRNEDWMDIPVLVTSGMVDPGTRRLVYQAGGTAFLEKPVMPQALRAAVAELLLPEAPRS